LRELSDLWLELDLERGLLPITLFAEVGFLPELVCRYRLQKHQTGTVVERLAGLRLNVRTLYGCRYWSVVYVISDGLYCYWI
jgi:hypothetical protein